MALAAVFPGDIYLHAAFPMSMTVFFVVLCLYLLRDGRNWRRAGLAGAIAALSHPAAVMLVPTVGLWGLIAPDNANRSKRVIRAATCAGIVCLGLLAGLGAQALWTGKWNGFFLVQASYHHGFHDPFALLWPMIHAAFTSGPTAAGAQGADDWEAVQVAVLCLVVFSAVLRRLARNAGTRWELVILVYVLASWLYPADAGQLKLRTRERAAAPGSTARRRTRGLYCYVVGGFLGRWVRLTRVLFLYRRPRLAI